MLGLKTKTFRRTLTSVALLIAAPFAVTAQDLKPGQVLYVDVFQDGSLFLTYDEYLDRQRRVLEARNAGRPVAPLVIAPETTQSQSSTVRAPTQMSLEDQWSIGSFR